MDALTPSSLPTLKIRKRKVSVEKVTTPPKQAKMEESSSPQEEKTIKLDVEKENTQEEEGERKPHLPSVRLHPRIHLSQP
jgi:hypothetical protein